MIVRYDKLFTVLLLLFMSTGSMAKGFAPLKY